jgi:hypothetical protein|tara:strand:- start:243 stop:497 length:255 start_codon:yes stop_codon:yes gene_type:complete
MTKPDESGTSVIIGIVFFFSSFALANVDPSAPVWFLLLLGCGGTWLATYPLFVRHFVVKGLIQQGNDPEAVKQRWKINLGFAQI